MVQIKTAFILSGLLAIVICQQGANIILVLSKLNEYKICFILITIEFQTFPVLLLVGFIGYFTCCVLLCVGTTKVFIIIYT